MKTPMQEAIEKVQSLRQIDAVINPIGVIESILSNMLEKEKEVMQDFATDYERECRINLERSIEKCWDETFNTEMREVDAYCRECDAYICDERVTFEECCDVCGTDIEYK